MRFVWLTGWYLWTACVLVDAAHVEQKVKVDTQATCRTYTLTRKKMQVKDQTIIITSLRNNVTQHRVEETVQLERLPKQEEAHIEEAVPALTFICDTAEEGKLATIFNRAVDKFFGPVKICPCDARQFDKSFSFNVDNDVSSEEFSFTEVEENAPSKTATCQVCVVL